MLTCRPTLAGTFDVTVNVTDQDGQSTAGVTTLTVVNPPVTTTALSGRVGNNEWYLSAVSVKLMASGGADSNTIHYQVDGSSWEIYNGSLVVVEEGVHLVSAYAVDAIGDKGIMNSTVIKIDRTPPIVFFGSPASVLTSSSTHLNWSADDPASGIDHYEVQLDHGPFVSIGNVSNTTLILSDGPHVVTVRAVNRAGLTVDASIGFRVDTNVFSLSGPYNGLPSVLVIVAVVAAALFVLLRRRKGKIPHDAPPPTKGSDPPGPGGPRP